MKIILLLFLSVAANAQFTSSNAKKLQGLNINPALRTTCTDGQQITWVAANSRFECGGAGGGGSGITTLNSLSGTTQTFATPGTTGTAPNWVSSGSAHTLHIPLASAASVTGGLVTNAWYDTVLLTTGLGSVTQAYDADLAAVAALASNGCIAHTGAGTAAVRTITGTANEISVADGDCVAANPTISLPAVLDLGGKTSLEIPNAAAPTVNVFAQIAGDNNLWAASRGAPVFYDGTAAVALVGALVSDVPTNGQVPKWNTGGTITWEDDSGVGGASALTDLTDCKVTTSGATLTMAACNMAYLGTDGRWTVQAMAAATWAVSGGTDTGTARFEIDPNGGSPIFRCLGGTGLTLTNYTPTGCTESAADVFSVGAYPLASVSVVSGAWSTITPLRAIPQIALYTAGSGLNKSGNAFSLGTFTLKTKIALPLVGCAGTSGTLMWDTLATLAPTATCSAGTTETTMMRGVADWPDSDGDYSVQFAVPMPDDWDTSAALDAIIFWRTSATTGDAVFQVQAICRADAEVDDAAWNTASTVTDTAKGTTLQLNTTAITNITKTGCAAGELLHIRLLRNRTHASDTLAAVLSIGHVELTARRSITP